MNISQVAKLTNLSAKSIRLYESKGVIAPPQRSENGYRVYHQSHVNELLVVAKARRAGFTLDECKALVHLASNPNRTSAEVKARAEEKLVEVNRKLQELLAIKEQLEKWVAECPGDAGTQCPIIEDLKKSS